MTNTFETRRMRIEAVLMASARHLRLTLYPSQLTERNDSPETRQKRLVRTAFIGFLRLVREERVGWAVSQPRRWEYSTSDKGCSRFPVRPS
jgi:hypothetical protein